MVRRTKQGENENWRDNAPKMKEKYYGRTNKKTKNCKSKFDNCGHLRVAVLASQFRTSIGRE